MSDIQDIREAWVECALDLWSELVRDIQRGQPNEADRIEEMCKAIGWGDWFLDNRGGEGYDEGPGERWCGIGQAYIASEMLPDRCGYKIHPDIAKRLLPGTDRLYDKSRWQKIGFERPDTDADPKEGMIACVGDGQDGSHVVLIRDVIEDEGKYTTVECNGTGILGDGYYGEGVVRRFDVDGVHDYEGDHHSIRARPIDGIKATYPFDMNHFVGV